jgi:hypothetical protein
MKAAQISKHGAGGQSTLAGRPGLLRTTGRVPLPCVRPARTVYVAVDEARAIPRPLAVLLCVPVLGTVNVVSIGAIDRTIAAGRLVLARRPALMLVSRDDAST